MPSDAYGYRGRLMSETGNMALAEFIQWLEEHTKKFKAHVLDQYPELAKGKDMALSDWLEQWDMYNE